MNPIHSRLARRLLVPVVSLALLAGSAAPASAAAKASSKQKTTSVKEKKQSPGSATGRKIR